MSAVPDVVLRAAAESAPSVPAPAPLPGRPRRGDLRFVLGVNPDGEPAHLALVLSVDEQTRSAEIMMAHGDVEMACEIDAVVSRDVAGTNYRVVVETDLRSVVWTKQLGAKRVGFLSDAEIAEVERATTENDVEGRMGIHAGLRLAGVVDPRWEFKREEGDRLQALASDCLEVLLDGDPWLTEPGLFQPERLAEAADPGAVVKDLVWWAETRSLEIRPSDLAELFAEGDLDVDRWTESGIVDLDQLTALQAVWERAATTSLGPTGDPTGAVRVVTAAHLGVRSRDREPDVVRFLGVTEAA